MVIAEIILSQRGCPGFSMREVIALVLFSFPVIIFFKKLINWICFEVVKRHSGIVHGLFSFQT